MVENSTMNGCDAFVVIGAQYGDEGKGAQVGNLAAELSSRGKCVIGIRSNGGSNAGHTVYVNGLKLATHQVPIAMEILPPHLKSPLLLSIQKRMSYLKLIILTLKILSLMESFLRIQIKNLTNKNPRGRGGFCLDHFDVYVYAGR
jgi:hypothetical protein